MFTIDTDSVHEYLFTCSGATARSLRHFTGEESFSFFKPLKGTGDFFYRGATVFSAPVLLTMLALGHICNGLFHGLKAISHDLIFWDLQTSSNDFSVCLGQLAGAFVMCFAAFLSPIVNFVDLAGSIVKNDRPDSLANQSCAI